MCRAVLAALLLAVSPALFAAEVFGEAIPACLFGDGSSGCYLDLALLQIRPRIRRKVMQQKYDSKLGLQQQADVQRRYSQASRARQWPRSATPQPTWAQSAVTGTMPPVVLAPPLVVSMPAPPPAAVIIRFSGPCDSQTPNVSATLPSHHVRATPPTQAPTAIPVSSIVARALASSSPIPSVQEKQTSPAAGSVASLSLAPQVHANRTTSPPDSLPVLPKHVAPVNHSSANKYRETTLGTNGQKQNSRRSPSSHRRHATTTTGTVHVRAKDSVSGDGLFDRRVWP